MANRYNKYQQVDYVHMPIEAYQMALGARESEQLGQLAGAKQQQDLLASVESSYNPDAIVKNDAMQQLHEKIDALAGKNLRTQDTLLELNKVVNDPNIVNAIAGVASNTASYKAAQLANKTYSDTYGNDINTVAFQDQVNAYNQQGKAGFKAGFMKDYNPGKFIDMQKETQDAFEKAKQDGYKRDAISGRWITSYDHLGLTLPDLLKKFGPQLGDAKYAQQMNKYIYYEARKWGDPSNPQEAIANYNGAHATELDNQLSQAATHLSNLVAQKKKLPANKAHALDADIENAQQFIKDTQGNRDQYANDKNGTMMANDVFEKVATGSASLFVQQPDITHKVNPYGLEEWRSILSLGNAEKLEKLKQKNKISLFEHKKNALLPESKVTFGDYGGPTSQYQEGLTKTFNENYKDLDLSPGQTGTKKQWGDDTILGQAGNDFYNSILTSLGKEPNKPDTTVKTLNPKILDFTSYANKQGFGINTDLIKLNGSTPASKAEFEKLKNIQQTLKTSGNANIAGLSVDFGSVADPSKVTDYLMKSITAAGNMVTNEEGKQVPFTSILGDGSKAQNATAKAIEGLTDKSISSVVNPLTNKIAITGLDGKTYFVSPDIGSQRRFEQSNNILRPDGNIGTGVIDMGTNSTEINQKFVSIGSMDKSGNINRDLYVANPTYSNMSKEDAGTLLKNVFKTYNSPDIEAGIPKDGATIYFHDVVNNRVNHLPYADYMAHKDQYDTKWGIDQDPHVIILARDKNGAIDLVNPAIDPVSGRSLEGSDLIHMVMGKNLRTSMRGIIKGPDKQTASFLLGMDAEEGDSTPTDITNKVTYEQSDETPVQ